MTPLLLEIPYHQDVELLLALFRRLDVRVVEPSIAPAQPITEEDVAFITAGLREKEDFEGFVHKFEEGR